MAREPLQLLLRKRLVDWQDATQKLHLSRGLSKRLMNLDLY